MYIFRVLYDLITIILFVSLSAGTQERLSSQISTTHACQLLSNLLGDQVSFPGGPQRDRYWSLQQAEIVPTCRVEPRSAKDVATVLSVIRDTAGQFAVRGGGHAAWGASTVGDGINIDLGCMKDVDVSDDFLRVNVGAGCKWTDVYATLDPMGLSLVGGRAGDVGVGGFMLGGGTSFLSGRYGWGLDNVLNYELVLANGSIVDVNYKSEPDIFFALRGGGNNFGIVTRFDISTFKQGLFWSNLKSYSWDKREELNEAFAAFNQDAPTDADATVSVLAYLLDPESRKFYASVALYYGRPVHKAPAIFRKFEDIPPRHSSSRNDSMSNFALEMNDGQPSGYRNLYLTHTFHNSALLMSHILDIYTQEMAPLLLHGIPDLVAPITFQTLHMGISEHFSENGGNALGLSLEDGPLTIMALMPHWSLVSTSPLNALVISTMHRILHRSVAEAEAMGLSHKYIYMPYADGSQAPFAGYGEENLGRLRAVAADVDPQGLFKRFQGFKL